MGKTKEQKQEMLADIKQNLSESQLTLVINYQGLSVAEITDLRRRLIPTGSACSVAKNTLMGIAVKEDSNWQPMEQLLAGSNAFLFLKDDIGGAIKAYQDFQKSTKKTEFKGGVMEGRLLTQEQVKAIADLPSKEELLAQVAGAINSIATKLAISLNAVPTQLATGINEVPASVNRAIKAISDKEQQGDAG
ncbi:MAG: 50S ribosomal protein L10 [Okeania sp. SIO2F4]|uniref:50S ribosomal protein L10 n=1 Tax=Okeania sp. SIO2F4 TaxID=2607790 RepID=UPI00142CAF50|nr:50S ribosomal protein L10 [Okeania sp. SIO2F4]NES01519.1 50S ribosomal protein L10 [Okeania sp. SIO2F4]